MGKTFLVSRPGDDPGREARELYGRSFMGGSAVFADGRPGGFENAPDAFGGALDSPGRETREREPRRDLAARIDDSLRYLEGLELVKLTKRNDGTITHFAVVTTDEREIERVLGSAKIRKARAVGATLDLRNSVGF